MTSWRDVGYVAVRRSQAKGRRAETELAQILWAAGFEARPGWPQSYGTDNRL